MTDGPVDSPRVTDGAGTDAASGTGTPGDAPPLPRFARAAVPAFVADLVCIGIFVGLGRESHGYEKGVTWFLSVWWPLAVGFTIAALVTRLYTDPSDWPARLFGTVALAIVIGGPLRALHGREVFSVFTVVALGMLCLLTFGWRLLRIAWRQSRGTASA